MFYQSLRRWNLNYSHVYFQKCLIGVASVFCGLKLEGLAGTVSLGIQVCQNINDKMGKSGTTWRFLLCLLKTAPARKLGGGHPVVGRAFFSLGTKAPVEATQKAGKAGGLTNTSGA